MLSIFPSKMWALRTYHFTSAPLQPIANVLGSFFAWDLNMHSYQFSLCLILIFEVIFSNPLSQPPQP
jgi:hypothetical protein